MSARASMFRWKRRSSSYVSWRMKVFIGLALAASTATKDHAVAAQPIDFESAEQPAAQEPSAFELAQNTPATGGALASLPPTPTSPTNPYYEADQLKIKGWSVPVPGASDTLDQGLFGVRDFLASKGFSYLGVETTTFSDNIIRHSLPVGNEFGPHSRQLQQYIGQLPSYQSVNNIYLNYDLGRLGMPGGQLTVAANLISTNYKNYGPDGTILAEASYYQTFFNKRVEVKVGYLQNTLEFLGAQVGGSLASGVFGPNASIATENGENSSIVPTLGINFKFNLPRNFYTKIGVQRAISPDGTVVERTQNPTGANLKISNAGIFGIDEMGYQVAAAPDQHQMWIRGGPSITTSRYTYLLNSQQRGQPNYGLYLLADRQLVQTAPHESFGSAVRGLYAGFSVEYTPSYFNRFSQYYEGRLYGFGLIPGRPKDLVSVVVTRNVFSEDGVRLARSLKTLAHDNANSITGSYGFRAIPGVSLNIGLQYTDHPTVITYTRSTGSALNILLNTVIFL